MRVGLLGGSFNPAHAAHRAVSVNALKRLALDRVWWLVTPSNPLKSADRPSSVTKRLATARKVANHPRIAVTGFEQDRASSYTIDTLRFLKRRYPAVQFVWLMGADNLAEFHRWKDWQEIFRLVPIAIFDRPRFRLKAMSSKAAIRFAPYRVDDSDALGLAGLLPPAWTVLSGPLSPLSSTALRGEKSAKTKAGGGKRPKRTKPKN
jgi:nicotinate-nucleotide adenylyltransferase